jgi:hypothetical protein
MTEPGNEDSRVPAHLRRARFARRTQFMLMVAAVLFALYRMTAMFRRRALR